MAGVDAFGLLKDELKSEEIQDQVNAARRVNTIALGMGEDRARSELIPFLRQRVDEYTDEILLAIAEAAGGLVKAIGGGEHAHMLIPLLEALAEKEETIVRQKAVESLVQVGKSMPASTLQSEMKELLKRLAGGDFFPSRISAAGLFATVYPSTPPAMRAPLRKMYEQLAKDEMPMVRSAAFAHMPALAAVVEREVLTQELSPLFNEMSQDMQESVRELAVDNMEKMVTLLSPEEAARIFGSFFDNVQMEKCSSMRVNKAKHFVKLVVAMSPARPLRDQVQAYIHLLASDPEVEVRNAAAANVGIFCSKLDGATVKGQILPVMKELAQPEEQPAAQGGANPNQQVRESIAENVCSLSPVIGREPTISELLPLVKLFLAEEQDGTASIEIRRKVLRSVAPLVETLGAEACDVHLMPEVLKMADDTQWRVRLSVVETMPVYARHLGMDLFNTRLKDIQARALADSVAHIRERAIANLSELSKEFGDEWMKDAILPSVQEAAKGTGPASYLGRITSLQAVSALATTMPGGVLSEVLVPQVCVPLARDRVVNVRVAAAEALVKCADKLQGENPAFVKDCIRPILVDLGQDTDVDVKYWAEKYT